MRYLVTGAQMKAIDQYTIRTIGIPSLVLMERAALSVEEAVKEEADKTKSILVFCGTGNNGADGIAAARMLYIDGYQVTVVIAGDESRASDEFRVQKQIAMNLDMLIIDWEDFLPGGCDVLIDAVFGVGLSRDVEGEYQSVLEMMNNIDSGAVIAVDMPSGISSDTGAVMGIAVKADITVTFGYEKIGSVLYPGKDYCGRLIISDLGYPKESLRAAGDTAFTYGPEDMALIPDRPEYSNKGTFGKVLIAAGSADMSGAAYLCALAAYRMGAGLVKILTPASNRTILQQLIPEAILCSYETEGDIYERQMELEPVVERECEWADVIVLGPGMGKSALSSYLIKQFLMDSYVPMVIDADGLNIISENPEFTQYFTENIIITPHLGEMSRLIYKDVSEIQSDLVGTASEYSLDHGIQCVLKDAATVVTGRDGQCYINDTGNSAMAKAGSGDVLSGTIAGLLALGLEPWDAAVLGVYLHGAAGDKVREKSGPHGLLAHELADEIGRLSKDKVR